MGPERTLPSISTVLANDTDVEGDTLTVSAVGAGNQRDHGDQPANGTIRYTPNAGFDGTDSFSYTVSDGNGGSDTATCECDRERRAEPGAGCFGDHGGLW